MDKFPRLLISQIHPISNDNPTKNSKIPAIMKKMPLSIKVKNQSKYLIKISKKISIVPILI